MVEDLAGRRRCLAEKYLWEKNSLNLPLIIKEGTECPRRPDSMRYEPVKDRN
jgi:hypothetical protein